MEKIGKKSKGSALIVAIMMATILGVAAIGINAIAFRQVNISETYSNGLVAFYSAESGLEEGLLRFRFNKDIEIPESIIDTADGDGLLRQPKNSYRNYLTDSTMRKDVIDKGLPLGYLLSDKSQVYDLQVFYKQKYYGKDANNDSTFTAVDLTKPSYKTDDLTIIKDETRNFSILNDAIDKDITIFWKWDSDACASKYRALEVKIKTNSVSQNNEFTNIFSDIASKDWFNGATSVLPVPGTSNVYTINVKSAMHKSDAIITDLSLKPVGSSVACSQVIFGFYHGDNTRRLTVGPNTTVRSIGYYFGTTREIKADISRQTGTILDLFNYAVYQGVR